MKLSIYMAKTYLGALALTVVGLSVLVVAVYLVESADRFTDTATSPALLAIRLSFFAALEYAWQVLPVACLLGALIAGTLLGRRGELLAIQAVGMSPVRPWLAFVVVALGTSSLGVACGEYVVPAASAEVARVQRQELQTRADRLTAYYTRRNKWYQDGELLLYLPDVDVAGETFADAVIYRYTDGMITEVIESRQLARTMGKWLLTDATVHSAVDGTVTSHETLEVGLTVVPADLIGVAGDPHQMRSHEVRKLIERRRGAGFDVTAHELEVNNRIAYPLLGVWLLLIAAPWVLDPDRRRSLAVSLGAGVVGIAVLLATSHVFRLAALGRHISAVLGAWGVALCCLAALPASYWLYGRYRTRGTIF